MTYLLDDNGNEIVLNTEVSVTKQVLSFFNFKIRGNFSTNFRIPNTSATRAALGYYGANQSEKVAFSTQAWGLYKNGNLLGRGFLVIQGQNRTELDCFFAYGNASWINLLSGNLKDLSWQAYDEAFTVANLDSLSSATSGMVFPYFDPGFNSKLIISQIVTQPLYGNSVEDFIYGIYPSFYVKTIVKEIAKQKQIKITGNIFDDPVFDKMVIPLPAIDRTLQDSIYMTDDDSYAGRQYIAAGATATITFAFASSSDGLLSLSNGRIVATKSVNLRVRIAFTFDSSFSGEVYLRKNGSTVNTYTFTVATFLRYQAISLVAGDYLDVQIKNNSASTRSVSDKYFGYQICGSWYASGLTILAADVVPNMNIIEFFKYIVQAFNCIVDFNDFTRTITINKIDSVRKENATDLTDTVVDYDIEWQNGFSVSNYVRTNQFEDIAAFNKGELKFGEFVFDGPDNGAIKNDIYELKLGPSVTRRTESKFVTLYSANVPLFELLDDGEAITYSTVTSNSGVPRFNTSQTITADTIVRIVDDNNLYNGYVYVFATGSTYIDPYSNAGQLSYQGTSSGKIYIQRINYRQAGYRALLNYPDYQVSKLCVASTVSLYNRTEGNSALSNYPFAFYYIPDSEFTFSDELKLGANPGDITNAVSIPLSTQYYNRLQKIARNPVINARLRISETLFNTINLSEFVYIDIGEWSGYFFVQKIDNYKDSSTDVRVQLLKVD